MSIWFAIWLVLSSVLIYFLVWTLFILSRQKRAWKEYAKNKKLRYKSGALLASPEVNGVVDNYTISIFTGEHLSDNMKSSRKLTALEINVSSKMPVSGGIASGGMVDLVNKAGLGDEFRPDNPLWNESYIAIAESTHFLDGYLTDERIKALASLMKIKNGWVIFIFRNDVSLLRFDTPYPLDSIDKIDKIVSRMIKVAGILELSSGESGKLKAAIVKKSSKEIRLKVSDRDINVTGGLQLEDEQNDDISPEEEDSGEKDSDKKE